jgi:serine/threonine protein kinase/tetratricopeptide (TPR) repeat protein
MRKDPTAGDQCGSNANLNPCDDLVGRRLLNYQVIERLGAGGMGEVYLAEDLRLGRRVAVKRVHQSLENDPHGTRLMLEARAVARLNHPGIAMIYDVFEVDNRGHIVMEFVRGQNLTARIGGKELPFETVLELAIQITEALVHAHENGIIHRDLKPANVHLTTDGRVKLLDFGIAKLQSDRILPGETTLAETSLPALMGTPAYMSPEQLLQRPVDPRTDIYSLCVLFFEMASGRPPFIEERFMELAAAILTKPVPSLKEFRPDVPDRFCDLIKRGTEKSRDDRWSSMAHVYRELRAIKDLAPLTIDEPRRAMVVAILPFRNATGDAANDFIGTGICEVLIANAARLPGLTVLSRGSVLQYNNADRDLKRISHELGATCAVDGSYQRFGDRIRVTAAMIDPRSDRVLWSDHVDGVLAGIFEIQTTLGERLLAALQPGNAPEPRSRPRFPTESVSAFTKYARARVLLERPDVPGNIDRAVELLERALKEDSRFALAHAALGEAYWNRYRHSSEPHWTLKALSCLTEAMRLDPVQPDIRRTLAQIYRGTGRNEEALEELRAARVAEPQSDETHRYLGEVLFDLGRRDEALDCFEQAIRLRPDFWENHRGLGSAWYRMGEYDRAIVAFSRVVELQPDSAWGFQMLGTVYHAIGQIDLALLNYERSMTIAPTGTAAANVGTIWYARCDYAQALNSYELAIKLRPNNPVYYRNRGDAYIKLGDEEKAKSSYQRAVELMEELIRVNPKDAEGLSRLAVYEAKLGRIHAACQHADQASASEPLGVEIMYRRGVVFALAGKMTEAAASVKLAVDRGFSFTLVEQDDDLQQLRASEPFIGVFHEFLG